MSTGYQDKTHKKSIFPQKLWQMVNDRRLDSAIKWNEDGRGFFVYEDQLKDLCLGKENKLFYTKQPKSFVRQLHLYGFRKITKNQFTHKFFQRDQPGLLKNIKRSYRERSITGDTNNNNNNHIENIKNNNNDNYNNTNSVTASSYIGPISNSDNNQEINLNYPLTDNFGYATPHNVNTYENLVPYNPLEADINYNYEEMDLFSLYL